jgi:hypothetical protein
MFLSRPSPPVAIRKATGLSRGDMVSWNSSGGRSTGKIERIIREGKLDVPDSSFAIEAEENDPAVLIRVYRDDRPTDTLVGHKMSALRTVSKANPYRDRSSGKFTYSPTGRAARSDVGVRGTTGGSIIDNVRREGGMSVTVSGKQPRTGYMVGTRGNNKEVPADEFFDRSKGTKILGDYIKTNRDKLSQPGAHLGLWHDKKNGEVVLDISVKVQSRSQARRLGRDWNQQAIWDVANGEEINTGGTGDRVG